MATEHWPMQMDNGQWLTRWPHRGSGLAPTAEMTWRDADGRRVEMRYEMGSGLWAVRCWEGAKFRGASVHAFAGEAYGEASEIAANWGAGLPGYVGIEDITWSDMTAAGLDTDCVVRRPTAAGLDEYIFTCGSGTIAFGPAKPLFTDDGGWNISAWTLGDDGGWSLYTTRFEPDTEQALRTVVDLAKPYLRIAVVWYVVRGPSPKAPAVEPGVADVEIPDEVLDWAKENGLDSEDPDVYMLVGLDSDQRGVITGELACNVGTVSAKEAARITRTLAQDAP